MNINNRNNKLNGIFLLIVILFVSSSFVYAAPYQKDPSLCPVTYMSQDCPTVPMKYACGYLSSTLYCETPAIMTSRIPASDTTTSAVYDASLGGGYVMDCLASSSTCVGTWACNRNSTCATGNRATRCLTSTTNSQCDVCNAGYTSCDASGNWVALDNPGTVQCTRQTNNYATSPCGKAAYGGGTSSWHTVYYQTTSCNCQCDASYLDCDNGMNGGDSVNGCEVQKSVTQRPNWAINHTLYGTSCAQFICSAGYIDFNGGPHDGSDTDGCEITIGEACTSYAMIPGTCNSSISPNTGTATSSGKSCTCIETPPVNFQTSVLAQYKSPIFLLWGQQNGPGPLMNLTNNLTKEGFIINNASWVGIGRTPTAKLDVKGNVSLNDTLYVTTAGNVGIGIANPSQKLVVVGDLNVTSGNIWLDFGSYLRAGGYGSFAERIIGTGSNRTNIYGMDGITLNPNQLVTPSNQVIINGNGSVGIGTLTPNYKLDVKGNVSLNDTLYVTNAGRVGIMSSIPSQELHVQGNANITGTLYAGAISAGATSYLGNLNMNNYLVLNIGNAGTDFTSTGGLNLAGDLAVDTNLLYVNTTSNNVGIGTTSPTQKLHVQGNATINGNLTVFGDLLVDGNDNFGKGIIMSAPLRPIITEQQDSFTSGNFVGSGMWGLYKDGGLTIGVPYVSGSEFHIRAYNSDSSVGNEYMTLNISSSTLSFAPNTFRISASSSFNVNNVLFVNATTSNVGIGNSNPTQILHVQGNANITGTLYAGAISAGATSHSGNIDMQNNLILNIGNAGTDFTSTGGLNLAGDLVVDTNVLSVNTTTNYVGIGTNNPQRLLHLQGAGGIPRIQFNQTSDNQAWMIGTDNSPIGFYIANSLLNSSNVVFIANSTGNVGIGTINPSSKLHVEGNSDVSDQAVQITINDTDNTAGSMIPSIGFYGYTGKIGTIRANDLNGFEIRNASDSANVRIYQNGSMQVSGILTAGSTPVTLTSATGYILETAITQDSLDDSEIEDNSLSAASLAANSVADSELMDSGDWITTGNLCIGTNAAALCVDTQGWLSDEDSNVIVNDVLQVTGNIYADGGNVYIGTDMGNDDDYLRMDDSSEYLRWYETGNYFEFSDDLVVGGSITPSADNTYNIGSASASYNNMYIGSGSIYFGTSEDTNLYRDGVGNRLRTDDSFFVGQDLYVTGNLYLQGNLTNYNVATINVNGSMYPSLTGVFDIGSGSKQWRNGNFSGTINAANVYATNFYGTLSGSADMVDNHHVTASTDNRIVKHNGANLQDGGILDTSDAVALILDVNENVNVTSDITIGGNDIKDSNGVTRITIGTNVIITIG